MLLASIRMLLALTLLTGVLYPAVVTGVAHLAFPRRAQGSLVVRGGRVMGSSLIGQPFSSPRYFWSRPSATSPPYNAASSTGSNVGPLHPALFDASRARITALRGADSTLTGPIPVDLVTASGSGLDPHISVASALLQAPRVARARGIPVEAVQRLIRRYTVPRTYGLFGEPVVRVLELNLALNAGETP